jgi:glucose-specific phosphotransferase system IIA component
MFGFKKQKQEMIAVCSGESHPICDSPDPAFAQKILGDGYLIHPRDTKIVSPVNGEVVAAFYTNHAFGIKSNDGSEILIHIGLESAALAGQGIESFVKQGDKVTKGQLIAEVDFKLFESKGICSDVMVIFTDGKTCPKMKSRQVIAGEDMLGG